MSSKAKRKLTYAASANSKKQEMDELTIAIEDLEDASLTMSRASQELLSPERSDNKEVVASTPLDDVVAESETQDVNARPYAGDVHPDVPSEAGTKLLSYSKEDAVEKLKDEVEMAMVANIVSYTRLRSILESIATPEEVAEFKERAKTKVRDVMRVAKKGVSVEKVTEYRIVDDDRVVSSSSRI